jgi:hypothetical protein
MRIAMLLFAILGFGGSMWAADPFVGTWRLNLEKSKFDPGPAPRMRIMKIEAQENGYKYTVDNVDAQGKPTNRGNTIKYDGKEYPLAASDTTITVKKIDENTHEIVIKQEGKQVQTGREVVSNDGKTMTRTIKGMTSQGQEYSEILVYEKQ